MEDKTLKGKVWTSTPLSDKFEQPRETPWIRIMILCMLFGVMSGMIGGFISHFYILLI